MGTATFVTNSQSEATQFFLNLPFGETMLEQMDGSYNNPFKFNAKELDEDTGLYYYGARYYNPRLSIWYGVDPLTEKMPSWSPYNYTFDNPVKYVDPDGKAPIEINDDSNENCCWGMFRPLMPLFENSSVKPTVIETITKTGETTESLSKTAEGTRNSSERIKYNNQVERAKDKMDGISRAQEKLKKNAPQGSKQNAIQSINKSKQNLKNALRRIDINNIDEFDVKVLLHPEVKKDNINLQKTVSPNSKTEEEVREKQKKQEQKQHLINQYNLSA
ncbi:RHS repeat domain-containing protein [Chryseobacterium oryctis]|uniref:RHS repeat-associated core domain-containing protein n=1 Tax=Chryseobacterium oryctis TaxID=2952618 RepID=A0ABT3HNK5_9FLAO|nr:RHS repeat-associated core domain-containing protein [Chryseobacterium oryctis]MCW3161375.1 RHS repeat-associated core domain-containing protein [Chryseobacterium oryctis]